MLDAASAIVGLVGSLVRVNASSKLGVYVQHVLLLYFGKVFHYQPNMHFQSFQQISHRIFMNEILSFSSCKPDVSSL